MYVPAAFREDRPEQLRRLMRANPFATLVTDGSLGLFASHVPLELVDGPTPHGSLRGHVARANPQWRDLEAGAEALVIFHGPHAYVSPSWYPSTHEHGRMVPTWNYEVVHAYGRARCIHEPRELLPLLRTLTEQHERDRPRPWSVDDAPPEFLEATARAVVGFEIPIERVEGKAKMSQNRTEADRRGAREGLRQGDAAERAVAERIAD